MRSMTQPTSGQRLWWVIKTTFITLFLLALVVGLALGAFIIYEEIRRSFLNVNTRIDANVERITLLAEQQDALAHALPGQQQALEALRADVDALTGRSDELAADLERQAIVLGRVTTVLPTLAAESEQTQEEIAALGTAVATLEGAAADDGLAEVRQALALFRVWELLTRARLRLIEENVALATADIEAAQETLDLLLAAAPPVQDTALTAVNTRLEVARQLLESDPLGAAAELESAWDALDAVITGVILPEAGAVLPEETPEASATPTPTPEP